MMQMITIKTPTGEATGPLVSVDIVFRRSLKRPSILLDFVLCDEPKCEYARVWHVQTGRPMFNEADYGKVDSYRSFYDLQLEIMNAIHSHIGVYGFKDFDRIIKWSRAPSLQLNPSPTPVLWADWMSKADAAAIEGVEL